MHIVASSPIQDGELRRRLAHWREHFLDLPLVTEHSRNQWLYDRGNRPSVAQQVTRHVVFKRGDGPQVSAPTVDDILELHLNLWDEGERAQTRRWLVADADIRTRLRQAQKLAAELTKRLRMGVSSFRRCVA